MAISTLKVQIKDGITGEFRTIIDCSDVPCTKEFNSSNGEVSLNYEGADITIEIPKMTS